MLYIKNVTYIKKSLKICFFMCYLYRCYLFPEFIFFVFLLQKALDLGADISRDGKIRSGKSQQHGINRGTGLA